MALEGRAGLARIGIEPEKQRVGGDSAEIDQAVARERAGQRRRDAAQHQRHDALGVLLCIGKRKRCAPRAAKDDPPVDAQVVAQLLDVGDEVRTLGRVALAVIAGVAHEVHARNPRRLRRRAAPQAERWASSFTLGY